MSNEIPDFVLKAHPEMQEVAEAINRFKQGENSVVHCRTCKQPITVAVVESLGVMEVGCPVGCTKYRSRWSPQG